MWKWLWQKFSQIRLKRNRSLKSFFFAKRKILKRQNIFFYSPVNMNCWFYKRWKYTNIFCHKLDFNMKPANWNGLDCCSQLVNRSQVMQKISLNRCLHFRENADLTRILRPAWQRLKRKVHWLLFGTFDLFHPAKLFTFLPGRHNYHRRYHNPSGKRQLFAPQRFLTFHSYENGVKYFLK